MWMLRYLCIYAVHVSPPFTSERRWDRFQFIYHFSIVHFDCIATFKMLYILTSIEGGAHTHYRSISACEPHPQSMFSSTLLWKWWCNKKMIVDFYTRLSHYMVPYIATFNCSHIHTPITACSEPGRPVCSQAEVTWCGFQGNQDWWGGGGARGLTWRTGQHPPGTGKMLVY